MKTPSPIRSDSISIDRCPSSFNYIINEPLILARTRRPGGRLWRLSWRNIPFWTAGAVLKPPHYNLSRTAAAPGLVLVRSIDRFSRSMRWDLSRPAPKMNASDIHAFSSRELKRVTRPSQTKRRSDRIRSRRRSRKWKVPSMNINQENYFIHIF